MTAPLNPIPTEILLKNMIREFLNEATGRGMSSTMYYWLMIWVKNIYGLPTHDELSMLIDQMPTLSYETYEITDENVKKLRHLFPEFFIISR